MRKEPSEIYVCKKHQEVVYQTAVNGIPRGMACDRGCDIQSEDDVRSCIAWVYTWEELGFGRNPFAYEEELS